METQPLPLLTTAPQTSEPVGSTLYPTHRNLHRKRGTAAGGTKGAQRGAPPQTAHFKTPSLQPRFPNPLAVDIGRTKHWPRAAKG